MNARTIIGVSVVTSFISAELFVARFAPQLTYDMLPDTGTGCYAPDPILFARPKPNTTCVITTPEYVMRTPINPQGFIGTTPVSVEKKTGTSRIAFIGDSMTFGQGVSFDFAYPFRVAKTLGAEIINASMVGAGPDWYYLRLKESLLPYRPDVVVVGLYVGNDLSDTVYFRAKGTDGNRLPTAITTPYEYVDTDGVRRSTSTPLRYRIPILRQSHLHASGNHPVRIIYHREPRNRHWQSMFFAPRLHRTRDANGDNGPAS